MDSMMLVLLISIQSFFGAKINKKNTRRNLKRIFSESHYCSFASFQ